MAVPNPSFNKLSTTTERHYGGRMTTHRKHTPIVSKRQRGFFGAEYSRKKRGLKGRTRMSKAELKRHLRESKGKKLPKSTGEVMGY